MRGPGRYDAECTAAREATDAQITALIVLGGSKGSGFSVQVDERNNPMNEAIMGGLLPAVLRDMADQIERDSKQ